VRIDASLRANRLFVLGLDGVPYSFMKEQVERGDLPHFESLLRAGGLRRMRSVHPTVSSAAWASFMTGKNPGKHNIYGFLDLRPNSYVVFVPTAADVTSRTLWQILSDHGKRLCVMNVPVTYPPSPINGVMISGFLCPDLDKATYPPQVAERLKGMGYRIDIDSWQARRSLDRFLGELHETLDRRAEALFHFYAQEDWDFFMAHILETDRLHHFLWEHMESGNAQYAPEFLRFYRKLDEILGEVRARLRPDTALIVLSDHGFCRARREVYLNSWLESEGWLKFRTEGSRSFEDMHPQTQAFSMMPGRIYIHSAWRYPYGCIGSTGEYNRVRERLIEEMEGLQDPDTGERIIRKVYRREEVFTFEGLSELGDTGSRSPDLLAVPYDGFNLKGDLDKRVVTERSPVVGMHTADDAMLYIADRPIMKEDPEITDVMPTILSLMGIPVPNDLDGSICTSG